MDPTRQRRQRLEMLSEEALDDTDAWMQSERFLALVALLGRAEVEQLVREAKSCLARTGGYIPDVLYPDPEGAPEGTIRLLMEQLEKDPARAKRLAEAYDTLEHEAAARE